MATPAAAEVFGAVDVELPPPAQHSMQPEQLHAAYISNEPPKVMAPKNNDQLYSKCICFTCGIGEVLGSVICGSYVQCCCCEEMEALGLGGKDGCPECMSACGLFNPKLEFGASSKFLCCKCGCVNPLEGKPFIVIASREIA
mmetsp:Transcript_42596/g.134106  ORF Transcript_42596/g.134106 Transcript_42596/m.134106 type:complete len:142 (+) Transcript_42596:65-490(+)